MLTIPEQEAQVLGFPSALFGFTPNDRSYWYEPHLPWLTAEQMPHNMPLDYRGYQSILCVGYIEGNSMAPRFPNGCEVHTMPLFERQQLVVGRVYTYRYWHEGEQQWAYEMGRLVKIGGNYLEVKADNCTVPSLWLLREELSEEVWDVREVTHYVSYPALG